MYTVLLIKPGIRRCFSTLSQFNGSEGEWFQKLTARFCSRQSWTLVQIKSRQKKDTRFNAFILVYTHENTLQSVVKADVQGSLVNTTVSKMFQLIQYQNHYCI